MFCIVFQCSQRILPYIAETTVGSLDSGLHFGRRQHGSNFNHCDVIAICNSYVWITVTYLLFCTVSEPCRITGLRFVLDRGCLSLSTRWKWTLSEGQSGLKELETSHNRAVQSAFWYLEPFRRNSRRELVSRVWRTWQTDRLDSSTFR